MDCKKITKFPLIIWMLIPLYSQDSFEEFLKQQQRAQQESFDIEENELKNYITAVTSQYEKYEREQQQEFEDFKKAVEQKWQNFKSPKSKEYVEYDDDLDSRATIDFEKGEVTVEIILEEELPSETEQASKLPEKNTKKSNSLKNKLKTSDIPPKETKRLTDEKAISKRKDVSKKKIKKKLSDIIKSKGFDGKPLLNRQLADKKGKTVTPKTADKYAASLVSNTPIKTKSYKAKDGKKRTVYTVKVPMKSDHINTRADRYKKEVLKQSKRFNIDPIIAFAVMETESAFNPKAKSHIPAYGLMQLVPKSGARDAYLYVYKKDKFVDGRYLYQPEKNIELGCAYLSKIRHTYFKSIKDNEKAYLCAIPAYNTGIGNVAKALTGNTKLKAASKKANSMSPSQLYNKLHKDLKYKEARDYLERVWTRKDKYSEMIH